MLSIGTGLGSIVSGAIILDHSWRVIYWVSTALTAFIAVLMFFTFPETIYNRDPSTLGTDPPHDEELPGHTHSYAPGDSQDESDKAEAMTEQLEKATNRTKRSDPPVVLLSQRPPTHMPSFGSIVTNIPQKHTQERIWKLSLRPIILIALPAVIWASLVMSVSIGFLIALSTNLSTAFSETYGFTTAQCAWCYVSSIVGSLAAVFFGGKLSDVTVDFFARRNDGVRDPEMRLPAMIISLVTGPLSLILYGVGVGQQLHWICPVFGLGLLNFTVVQASNIGIVYMIDCYRPIAGEVTLTQYAFKCKLSLQFEPTWH